MNWERTAMNIELEIEGVSDRAVIGAIRKRVRMLAQYVDQSEGWRVRLTPSEGQAEWDLGIRTASGWHVASFTAPVQGLPDLVEQGLRVQVAFSMADASPAGQYDRRARRRKAFVDHFTPTVATCQS